ncbi:MULTISPECIES: hypothetical protein [unclassified Bradyrhizobium]|uniref:hypothetical protein n=1 Tax=unclassified Bradyrhizobium TaxID=2631580 RepID=UPI002915C71A|nr:MULTISPECIES: hypothetical protein [unclassified Bradyrhizobium]
MDLSEYFLKAYRFARDRRLCDSQESFNELLKTACPSYVSNASTLSKLKRGGIGGRLQDQLRDALDAFCQTNKINLADFPELRQATNTVVKPKLNLETLPVRLTGRWLFVQYRSIRKDPKNTFPESGYRAAVLSYGRYNKKRKDVSIVGESTRWVGHVQMLGGKLYYFVDEYWRTRTGSVQESAFFVTFPPFDGDGDAIQNGVVLGISRGRYEHHAPPVYSSRVMLRQLPQPLCPPDADESFVRQRFCGYFDETMRDQQDVSDAARNFLSESFKLFEGAGEPPHSRGNHIFVNPIEGPAAKPTLS